MVYGGTLLKTYFDTKEHDTDDTIIKYMYHNKIFAT